jgi:hypothetical protein
MKKETTTPERAAAQTTANIQKGFDILNVTFVFFLAIELLTVVILWL